MKHKIQYWDKVLKRLRYPTRHKVMKLIQNNCIERLRTKNVSTPDGFTVQGKKFSVMPIKGYNSTTYTVYLADQVWHCNCQGYYAKLERGERPTCSHIMACRIYERLQESKKNIQSTFFNAGSRP